MKYCSKVSRVPFVPYLKVFYPKLLCKCVTCSTPIYKGHCTFFLNSKAGTWITLVILEGGPCERRSFWSLAVPRRH
jgi:hypothetical protein